MNLAALTIAFWLHMAATIVWIGGLFYQAVVVNPALQSRAADRGPLLEAMRRRFLPLAWLSLAVLIGTGLIQMSGSPNYEGLFSLANPWSRAIFTKHLAVAAMILVAAYQTWVLTPRMARLALKNEAGATDEAVRRQARLNQINLVLGILVLGLTAVARTALPPS